VVAACAGAAGWRVTAAGHTRGGLPRLDVRDPDQVRALVRAVQPVAVVHTAYVQNGDDAWGVTASGSGWLGRPYREDDPPSPLSAYGRAKAEAEALVTAADPGAVLVRTSLIYGGPGRPPAPPEQAAADPGAAFHTDELRCPVQVDDLAGALVELCGPGPAGEVAGPLHVAGPDGVSRWEFASLVAGRPVTGIPAPPGRPLDCRLDSARAAALLAQPLRGVREVYAPARR
jgi:dTDP-4-dehydrorhamnose reductase